MPTLHLWRWRLTNPVTGKLYTTRYAMSEPDALQMSPDAQKVPGSYERREVPDHPVMHSTTFKGPPQDPKD